MKNRPGGKAPSHKAQGARWLAPGIAALLFAGALALYWPATHFSFLNWDDLTFIAKNDHVKGGLTWESVKWVFTHAYSANWAPLSWISHMIDVQIHGLQPGGHHLTNSVLHAANSALLFFALLALTRARWRSAFVAALFAVHPLHVESVAWIAERRDVLSGLFFMLTLLTYGKYAIRDERLRGRDGLRDVPRISGHRIGGESRPGGIVPAFKRILASPAYWVCLVLFALGLMSKPMLVTMPFVLLLLDYWPLGRFDFQRSDFFRGSKTASPLPSFWRLLAEKIPFLLLSAATCAITFLSQRQAGAVASLETLSFGSRLENVPIAYCEYLEKFFWPSRLSPLYAHPPSWPAAQVLLCAAVLVAISLAAWKLRARFPYLLVGWCWFLGMLVPVIGLVQVGSQAFADRYTYLPLIGVMIALTWVVARVGRAYPRAAASDPAPAAVGRPMASPAGSSRLPSALSVPQSGTPYLDGGSFNWTLAVPAVVVIGLLYWRSSIQLGCWRDTQTLFGRVLQYEPANPQALYGLGTDLIDSGHADEGLVYLKKAIQVRPQYPQALGAIGSALDDKAKYAEAVGFYEAGLKADPNEPGILNNFAWLKATCPDASIRNGAEAVQLARRACEVTGYSRPLFIGTLAAAEAEAGDFSGAIANAEKAERLAASLRLDDVAERNRQLIELYRQGKPAR